MSSFGSKWYGTIYRVHHLKFLFRKIPLHSPFALDVFGTWVAAKLVYQ